MDSSLTNPNHISNRELQILHRIVAGRIILQISDELHISIRTVEKHIENMSKPFGCQNSTQLVAFEKDMDLL